VEASNCKQKQRVAVSGEKQTKRRDIRNEVDYRFDPRLKYSLTFATTMNLFGR
jgi:hypothetical protein